MPTVVIENPIINSPFEEPQRHWTFDENGVTDKTADSRRPSAYFIPIAQPRKMERQLTLETQLPLDRIKENDDINFVCSRVKTGGKPGSTFTESPAQKVHRVCREAAQSDLGVA